MSEEEVQAEETPAPEAAEPTRQAEPEKVTPKAEPAKTIAAGADDAKPEPEPQPKAKAKAEPEDESADDWRERMASRYAGDDKKALEKEKRRLSRVNDPEAIWGMYREMERMISEGNFVKVPKEDANEEEIQRYRDALRIPKEADGYIENLNLPEGMVLGDDDKAVASDFASAMHEANVPQAAYDKAMQWYYGQQEKAAEMQDEYDEKNRAESLQALRDELGPKLKGAVNSIGTLKPLARNDILDKMMTARLDDGTVLGDNADAILFLAGLAREINPAATVFGDSEASGKNIDEQLEELQGLRGTDKRKYYSNEIQERERELLAARDKIRSREAA